MIEETKPIRRGDMPRGYRPHSPAETRIGIVGPAPKKAVVKPENLNCGPIGPVRAFTKRSANEIFRGNGEKKRNVIPVVPSSGHAVEDPVSREIRLDSFLQDPDRLVPKYAHGPARNLLLEINDITAAADKPGPLPLAQWQTLRARLDKAGNSLRIVNLAAPDSIKQVFKGFHFPFAMRLAEEALKKVQPRPEN